MTPSGLDGHILSTVCSNVMIFGSKGRHEGAPKLIQLIFITIRLKIWGLQKGKVGFPPNFILKISIPAETAVILIGHTLQAKLTGIPAVPTVYCDYIGISSFKYERNRGP